MIDKNTSTDQDLFHKYSENLLETVWFPDKQFA